MYCEDCEFVNIYINQYVRAYIRKFKLLFFLHYIKTQNVFVCKLKINSYWPWITKNAFMNKIQSYFRFSQMTSKFEDQ